MVDVSVGTTQLERTVRDVRTFTTTPPGGREEKTQSTSAGVKTRFNLYVDKNIDIQVRFISSTVWVKRNHHISLQFDLFLNN